jgi:hypothetical protein
MAEPTLLADLEEFVTLHRPHGELRAAASPAQRTDTASKSCARAASYSSDG